MEDKDILLITPNVEDDEEGHFTFYADGTYRYSQWGKHDYAQWKIVEDVLWTADVGTDIWVSHRKDDDIKIVGEIQGELSLRGLLA